jgi:hypothetical protein
VTETRILYFCAEGNAVYRSAGRLLELEETFTVDAEGLERYRGYLAGHKGALFGALADLAGEDFHEDQIPFLRGADRESVVQRRLAQRYRDTRIAGALSLGTVISGERKNERLLLASFTNTEQLSPWLDALDEAGVRLTGVYSVPLLAPMLAARLGVKAGRAFVVTAHRTGLRQCYVEEGRLRFARLERVADMSAQSLALFVRSETQRLAQYLTTLRALPREGAPIQVLVVTPAGQKAAFAQVLVSDARLAFHAVDTSEAAVAVGLRALPESTLGEALYLHLLAKRAPREQFGSRADTRRYSIWKIQRGIVAAGALGFAACAMVAGARWLEATSVRDAARAQGEQSQAARQQYERITAGFPATQTSTENMRSTVLEFQRIAERSPVPEEAFIHVSQVLQRFPQMELDGLVWTATRTLARPPSAPGAPAPKPPAGDGGVQLEVSGRVNATQRNDYRGITAQVQQFAAALATAGFDIARTQLPFDITSEGTLTGDFGGPETSEAPRFTITLARRQP